jgi:hypothetical protein
MNRVRSVSQRRLILALGVILLLSFLPQNVTAAGAGDVKISAVKDSAGVLATLNNLTSADVSASLIFAVYGQNGKLNYVKEYPVTAGANSSANQRFDFDFAALPDYIIKLFAWDGSGFVPLCRGLSSCLSVTIDGSGVVYDGIGLNVSADPGVTRFDFVMIDEFTKRGAAYTGIRANSRWTHAKAEGVDVIIAYKPAEVIGSVLPDIAVSELPMANGVNTTRVLVSQ